MDEFKTSRQTVLLVTTFLCGQQFSPVLSEGWGVRFECLSSRSECPTSDFSGRGGRRSFREGMRAENGKHVRPEELCKNGDINSGIYT
jgi:hypothetical protein